MSDKQPLTIEINQLRIWGLVEVEFTHVGAGDSETHEIAPLGEPLYPWEFKGALDEWPKERIAEWLGGTFGCDVQVVSEVPQADENEFRR